MAVIYVARVPRRALTGKIIGAPRMISKRPIRTCLALMTMISGLLYGPVLVPSAALAATVDDPSCPLIMILSCLGPGLLLEVARLEFGRRFRRHSTACSVQAAIILPSL